MSTLLCDMIQADVCTLLCDMVQVDMSTLLCDIQARYVYII